MWSINLVVLLIIFILSRDVTSFSASQPQFRVRVQSERAFTCCVRPDHCSSHQSTSIRSKLNDDKEDGTSDTGRRGALQSLLGGALGLASMSANLGSVLIGTATNTDGSALAALYRRVLSIGTKNAAAVASQDLLSWIASSGVAATPEIQAWMAAQRKLQSMKRVAAVVGGAAGAASRRAAGGLVEDVVLAAAAGKVVNGAISKENQDVDVDADNIIEQGDTENVPLTQHEHEVRSGDELSRSCTKGEDDVAQY